MLDSRMQARPNRMAASVSANEPSHSAGDWTAARKANQDMRIWNRSEASRFA